MARPYRMTPNRRAALKRAQAKSAAKRRGTGKAKAPSRKGAYARKVDAAAASSSRTKRTAAKLTKGSNVYQVSEFRGAKDKAKRKVAKEKVGTVTRKDRRKAVRSARGDYIVGNINARKKAKKKGATAPIKGRSARKEFKRDVEKNRKKMIDDMALATARRKKSKAQAKRRKKQSTMARRGQVGVRAVNRVQKKR